MNETDLVRKAADGDLDAFTILVTRRRERVFWIACHVVGDAELARDVAQDVFLRLFKVIRRFRSDGRFDAWLYRMTVHLAIDALRRERAHRQAAPLSEVPEGAREAASSPGEGVRMREVRRVFSVLLTRLGRKQRTAFVLREIEGLTTAEVAEILETTESTVRNHILQARRILKKALREQFPEYGPRA